MADWKQITARIRRARTGKDPAGQLANLFAKTRDAMVAFELARYFESIGNPTDAGRWYFTAAEKFRRADWKTKAQECATRLGATAGAEIPVPSVTVETEEAEESGESAPVVGTEESSEVAEDTAAAITAEPAAEPATAEKPATSLAGARPRRRGRRGGRDHQRPGRRSEVASSPALRESRFTATPTAAATRSEEPPLARESASRSVEEVAELSAPGLRGRSGDPGLSSRLSQLEMNFRRLLSCAPVKLEESDRAPAGPGVWVLTDSDLSTYYYVESCQTLRVAIPNLMRGNAGRRGEPSVKPQLADHLGIPEARVAKYLSDHCVARWLQMDEGASHFAHFVISVLRPALNE
jgi:hypothetical protein